MKLLMYLSMSRGRLVVRPNRNWSLVRRYGHDTKNMTNEMAQLAYRWDLVLLEFLGLDEMISEGSRVPSLDG